MKFLRRCMPVPFLIALSLLSACSDWYLVPLCEIEPGRICRRADGGSAGGLREPPGSDGGTPFDGGPGPLPSLTYAAEVSLSTTVPPWRWVGVRGNRQMIFARPDFGKTLLHPMLLQKAGSALTPSPVSCGDCPTEIKGLNASDPTQRVLAGSSQFFLVRPNGLTGRINIINFDGSPGMEIYSGELLTVRPAVIPWNDIVIFTDKYYDKYQVRAYGRGAAGLIMNRSDLVGLSDSSWVSLSQGRIVTSRGDGSDEALIIKDGFVTKIWKYESVEFDDDNRMRFNDVINKITSMQNPGIDVAGVGDLNGDGIDDLVFSRGGNVYAACYLSMSSTVYGWTAPLITGVPGEPILSITVTDLDGDGDQDLAMETSTKVLFYSNNLIP